MLFLATSFQSQVAICCLCCPTDELFLVHSIILLLSHVAPLAIAWHKERGSEVQAESEGKAQGRVLAALG